MKYVLYCRKSTDTEDKQVQSLDSQESEMRSLAEREGLNIVATLLESRSAKSVGRPVFAELLRMIQSGEADAILCWKLDRLARNFIDAGQIIELLQRSTIKQIRTYESTHLPTDNVLMLAVQLGMANQYSIDLSANVKRGNRTKLEKGEWPNHAPFGYLNDKNTKTLIPDPARAPFVRQAFELYASGKYSYKDIAEKLYQSGLRTRTGNKVFKGTIKRILDNPFYHGMMERHGKLYAGKHESIISKQTYYRCLEVSQGFSRPRKQKHFFPLRGLITCDVCNCLCTGSIKKGHKYQYCTNGKGVCEQHRFYTREDDLHPQVAKILGKIKFNQELIEITYEAAKQKYSGEYSFAVEAVQNVQKRLQFLAEREERLLDSYTAGITRPDLYEAKMQDIANERTTLEAELNRAKTLNPLDTLEPTKNLFLQASTAKKDYLEGDDQIRHNVANNLLWNLTLRDQKIAQYKFKRAYALMANAPKKWRYFRIAGW